MRAAAVILEAAVPRPSSEAVMPWCRSCMSRLAYISLLHVEDDGEAELCRSGLILSASEDATRNLFRTWLVRSTDPLVREATGGLLSEAVSNGVLSCAKATLRSEKKPNCSSISRLKRPLLVARQPDINQHFLMQAIHF